MDGDDQSSESSGGLIDRITDLASSRPDGISEDEREELIESVTDLLSEEVENRQILANHGGAFEARSFALLRRKNESMNPLQTLRVSFFA